MVGCSSRNFNGVSRVPEKLLAASGEETVKALMRLGFAVRFGKGDPVVLQNDQMGVLLKKVERRG